MISPRFSLFFGVVALALNLQTGVAADAKPNIVVIVADDLGWGDGTWKLVVTGGSVLEAESVKAQPKIELFNLEKDPGEARDLATENAERVAAMLERMRAHRRLKIKGISDLLEGKKGFVAPKEWLITG